MPPEVAVWRLSERGEESRGVFADLDYLKRVQERFLSQWFRELFERRGTRIHLLDTNTDLESMKQRATELFACLI